MSDRVTMTTSQLVKFLSGFPPDTPVYATWEGVHAGFAPTNFAAELVNGKISLVADVEDYINWS